MEKKLNFFDLNYIKTVESKKLLTLKTKSLSVYSLRKKKMNKIIYSPKNNEISKVLEYQKNIYNKDMKIFKTNIKDPYFIFKEIKKLKNINNKENKEIKYDEELISYMEENFKEVRKCPRNKIMYLPKIMDYVNNYLHNIVYKKNKNYEIELKKDYTFKLLPNKKLILYTLFLNSSSYNNFNFSILKRCGIKK